MKKQTANPNGLAGSITGRNNETLRRWASLKDKKARRRENAFLLEGARLVSDAAAAGASFRAVFADDGFLTLNPNLAAGFSCPVYAVEKRLMKELCDTVTPQGVAAVASIPTANDALPDGNCLILDGVADAGNLGTLLRTAAGFNFKDVYTVNCADAFNPKCVRSAMSATFSVKIRDVGYEIYERLKKNGFTLVAADAGGADVGEYRNDGKKTALVIGGEARGIGRETRLAADKLLSVKADGIESLNAAVAGGIMMFQLSRGQTARPTVQGAVKADSKKRAAAAGKAR